MFKFFFFWRVRVFLVLAKLVSFSRLLWNLRQNLCKFLVCCYIFWVCCKHLLQFSGIHILNFSFHWDCVVVLVKYIASLLLAPYFIWFKCRKFSVLYKVMSRHLITFDQVICLISFMVSGVYSYSPGGENGITTVDINFFSFSFSLKIL